jgi:hypothetical protein
MRFKLPVNNKRAKETNRAKRGFSSKKRPKHGQKDFLIIFTLDSLCPTDPVMMCAKRKAHYDDRTNGIGHRTSNSGSRREPAATPFRPGELVV